MTVLEKIKRCVSLVWDFQEIYGEEDIEEFCHNELSTYPQHDEIMEYFKHIEELEKENAELKDRNQELLESCEGATMMYKDLCKAKEIIKYLCGMVRELNKPNVQLTNVDYSLSEAEQFLKNDDCPNVMCEDCTKDCGIKKLGLVKVEK